MIKCKQNYIGKKFNHLTVIEQVDDFVSQSNNRHRPQFLCQCDCKKDNPKTIVVRLDSLKSGHTASCGCVKLKHTLELCEEICKKANMLRLADVKQVTPETISIFQCVTTKQLRITVGTKT